MQLRIFSSMSLTERRQLMSRYMSFLRERDGTPDCTKRQLSRREEIVRDVEENPVRRSGPVVVEQQVYNENTVDRDVAAEGLNTWTLWAICLSKCSRYEEYSVRFLEESGRSLKGLPDDPYTFIDLEERYHGRLLDSILQIVSIEPGWRPPPLMSRLLLRAILAVPRAVANITVLCGEIIGLATFKLLLEMGRKLCADQPQARERMEFLFKQILVDEIGHVLFLHSQLGPIRLGLARLLLPLIARMMVADSPEMRWLFGRGRVLDEIMSPLLLQSALDDAGEMPLFAWCAALDEDTTGGSRPGEGLIQPQ